MRTELERSLKTEYDRVFTAEVAIKAPGERFWSMVVFPSFWTNIGSLMEGRSMRAPIAEPNDQHFKQIGKEWP